MALLISVFVCSVSAESLGEGFVITSKKKTPPPKKEEATGPKKTTGELIGTLRKDKKDFKVYVLLTKDGKTWIIDKGSISKISRYYGRKIKIKATFYTAGGKHFIESFEAVSRG